MLIHALFDMQKTIVEGIFNLIGYIPYIGNARLDDIPYIGDSIVNTLTTVALTINAFIETVPYFEIVWNLFLFGVIPLEIGLIVLRFFLGNRTPQATN